jgi:glucosamine--fructose-6-phosphate aminotransferase (isomerizing)
VITSYHSRVCYQDALVIGITQSGMAEDVRSVIAHAKKQKALTLSCTNNNDSPVAREADYHLYCNAEEEKSVAATKTFMAQMYAMISLLTAWDLGKRGGADSGGALRKALAALPEKLDLLLQRQDEIIPLMKSYKFMDRCFVLGRGLMYPIVKEAALKIMETTYTAAFAYPISDFWHGPLAMIHKQTPVFLYSGGGQLENDELEILSRLKEIGADVLAVTPSEAIASRADRFYMIPQTETFVIPFYHLVIAQLFAYGLTLEKGMDADSPRHIVKVTITK